MALTISVRNYHILQPLGTGAMGEVYLAEDTRLKRRVALKLMSERLASDSEHRARFLREARAASSLNHPNVCVIHDIGQADDGRPYFAMEFIEGKNLARLVRERPLKVEEVVSIAVQVADALDAAYEKGLIHRDIKPSNICIDERGRVKVLDFGLAKRVDQDPPPEESESQLVTSAGMVVGTPAFMSPEQALAGGVDHRSDLFSLGAVIYQMLTGHVPFAGDNYSTVLNNVLHAQPLPIARFNYDVPQELERITLKLLAKDADRRFQSARELLVDLKNVQRDLELGPVGGSTPGRGLPTIFEAGGSGTPLETLPHGQVARPTGSTRTVMPLPESLANSDVVISYAHLDDEPIMAGRRGWISQFHRNLELRVAQLSGKQVTVLKQPDPSVAEEIENLVLKHVPTAKTIVSVLSPPFVRSRGCRRMIETFWRTAEDSGLFEVASHSRVLKVVKTPVEEDEIPVEIRPLLSRLVPYEFFERDPHTGRLREFDEAFGEAAMHRFYERVYDVAFDISQVLKYMGQPQAVLKERQAHTKTIYLAATTSDLEGQRDQLRRELSEMGHEVLPKQPLPLVASEIASVVQSCLERCDLAIHFVGEHYGFVPEATERSIVALQNQVAAQRSAHGGLKRLIWIAKGLSPRDERLHSQLWVDRARRFRAQGQLDSAARSLEQAGQLWSDNPGIHYENALVLQQRGQEDEAETEYRLAVRSALDLKRGADSHWASFLARSLRDNIEPLVSTNPLALAIAAQSVAETTPVVGDLEARWLLKWCEEQDADDDARQAIVEQYLDQGEEEAALDRIDAALQRLGSPAEPSPEFIRRQRDWWHLKERCLARLGRAEEADQIRQQLLVPPIRPSGLSPKLIDLSAHYNASLYDGRWHESDRYNCPRMMPETFPRHGAIDFDLRGLIQLNSGTYVDSAFGGLDGRDVNSMMKKSYPDEVLGIQVQQSTAALYLLMSCVYGSASSGDEVARIVVHYADDTTATIPLRYGEDVIDWANIDGLPSDKIGWLQRSDPRRHISIVSWKNPEPAKTISSLDFVSGRKQAAPFLVAVTAE